MAEVSVIIPTWNRADLLVKAVRSAISQTLKPLEVLVCDDGSTDDSEGAIRTMQDTSVRWLTGERAGRPAIPRNRGVCESKGEWIAFLDNDDEWLPDKLEKQLRFAECSGCKAVCSNALRYIPGRGVTGSYLNWPRERITYDDLLRENHVICSSAVIHRSLFQLADGFPESPILKAWEDYALWLRLAVFTDFAYMKEPLLFYRDDVTSSIRSNEVDVTSMRKAVLADFQTWSKRRMIDTCYLSKFRKRLQREKIGSAIRDMLASVKGIKQKS